MAKAKIIIVSARKEFTKEDLDAFRRILNVLHEHDLSACLEIKTKAVKTFIVKDSKLKII